MGPVTSVLFITLWFLTRLSLRLIFSLYSVNGSWSNWTVWGECSKSCDSGLQKRYRECNNPSPVGGGLDCLVESTEERSKLDMENRTCNTNVCDRKFNFSRNLTFLKPFKLLTSQISCSQTIIRHFEDRISFYDFPFLKWKLV